MDEFLNGLSPAEREYYGVIYERVRDAQFPLDVDHATALLLVLDQGYEWTKTLHVPRAETVGGNYTDIQFISQIFGGISQDRSWWRRQYLNSNASRCVKLMEFWERVLSGNGKEAASE